MELDIVIQSETGRRSQRLDAPAEFIIGRDDKAGLRLDSDRVSRRHAVVRPGNGGLQVEDRSTNGTLVGQHLLHKTSVDVPYGTPIVVGEFTLFINVPGATAPPPPAAPVAAPAAAAPMAAPPPSVRPGPQSFRPAPMLPNNVAPASLRPLPRVPPRPAALPPGTPVDIKKAEAEPPAAAVVGPSAKVPRRQQVELRREVHQQLIDNLDLATVSADKLDDPSMRPKVLAALRRIIERMGPRLPPDIDRDVLVGELADEALGLGPLEELLADPAVTEIMVVDADTIYVERGGRIVQTDSCFTDDDRVRAVIERIVTPLGRRIDESSPLVDARLKDGSRVNAVIRPIALRGSCITIRKFSKKPLTLENLIGFNALTEQMARFLTRSVIARRNIVISGGTGSGKTTLLNVLSSAIPSDERIVTIEDAAELQLKQPHVVSLETRPANMEGKGAYTIRDLLKNAMRMRPDRIVVGECRGGEALDMLQAMNTGHDGSLTTTHANSPAEAIKRLETLSLMAGVELPSRAIREQLASSVHLIVQQARLSDGTRKVTAISEIVGIDSDDDIELLPLFQFVRTGTGPKGEVVGQFKATGYLPSFLNYFIVMGLVKKGEPYL